MKFYIFIIRMLCLGITFVYAEIIQDNATLEKSKRTITFIYSKPMIDILYQVAVQQDKIFGLHQTCISQYIVKPYSISVLQPIDFPDDAKVPIKGVWSYRFQIQRCGELKFYNVWFIATGDIKNPLSVKPYYPGLTNANPLLIKDAMPSAFASASILSNKENCKEINIFDMYVAKNFYDRTEGAVKFKNIWDEIWIFNVCGKKVNIPIRFIPDINGSGTSFFIDINRTK